jgi:hypothetical protein
MRYDPVRFPEHFRVSAGMSPYICLDHFFPRHLQFIIHSYLPFGLKSILKEARISQISYMKLDILTLVKIPIVAFWIVTPRG